MSYIIAVFDPLIAGWVLYMLRLDFFFNILGGIKLQSYQFFYFFEVPLTQNYCYAASMLFF